MILYHGTSTKHLDKIQQKGILPRRITRLRSNWKGEVESKPDFVYLSTAYPVYYALEVADNKKTDLAIIKVDVDESELYPDEDFIARIFWEQQEEDKIPLQDFNPLIAPSDYKYLWRECINHNGTACTVSVPVEQIIDYKIISRKNIGLILNIGGDSIPIPINYKICGENYIKCIEALFEGGEEKAWEVVKEQQSIFENMLKK